MDFLNDWRADVPRSRTLLIQVCIFLHKKIEKNGQNQPLTWCDVKTKHNIKKQ